MPAYVARAAALAEICAFSRSISFFGSSPCRAACNTNRTWLSDGQAYSSHLPLF